MSRVLPFPISMDLAGHQWEESDFRLGPDGRIWTFLNEKLARINPDDGSVEFVGSTGRGGRLAFSGDDLYLGGTERLRRIKGVVGR